MPICMRGFRQSPLPRRSRCSKSRSTTGPPTAKAAQRLEGGNPVRNLLIGLLLLVAPAAWAQQSPPEIPFDSVPDFIRLPHDMYLGEASAVAVNSKGDIFVFSRGGSSMGPAFAETAAQILEFAPDGKYLREIGKNLYAWSFAHGLRIDPHDNIWAIDKGSNMVVKFRPDGRVDMVFGRKDEASDEG